MLVPSRNVMPSWTPRSWARRSSRSQTPRWAQRMKVCAARDQGPSSAGMARHLAPFACRQTIAAIVRRRSFGAVLPLGRQASISGSSFIHAPSVSIAPSSFQEEQNARHHKQFKLEQALKRPADLRALASEIGGPGRRDRHPLGQALMRQFRGLGVKRGDIANHGGKLFLLVAELLLDVCNLLFQLFSGLSWVRDFFLLRVKLLCLFLRPNGLCLCLAPFELGVYDALGVLAKLALQLFCSLF